MQRVVLTAVIAILLNFTAQAQDRKVAVFDPAGNVENAIKDIIREEIISIIVNVGGYTVLERELMNEVLKENRFQESGLVDDSQISEMGKLLGANLVFVANITEIDGNYHIALKLVDPVTGRIEKQQTAQTRRNLSELTDTVEETVGEMFGVKVKRSPETIRQARIAAGGKLVADGQTIYMNGMKLTKKDVRAVMTNTDALMLYNKGISRNRQGNLWTIAGLCVAAGGGYVLATLPFEKTDSYTRNGNPYYVYDDRLNSVIGWTAAATGAIMSITGLSLKASGKKIVKNSANTYNHRRGWSYMELDWGFTGNGVILVLNF